MIYTTEVFRPQDLQFNKFYKDMIRQTGEQVPANGSMHPQMLMDIDAVNDTLPVRPGFELADPVLLELAKECSRAERDQRPMIDAPHALLSRMDRGNRVYCCHRSRRCCRCRRLRRHRRPSVLSCSVLLRW